MTTVEKIDSQGNRYLIIKGRFKDHRVPLTFLKDVANRSSSITYMTDSYDFIPKIIEEWLKSYSSEGKSGNLEDAD